MYIKGYKKKKKKIRTIGIGKRKGDMSMLL